MYIETAILPVLIRALGTVPKQLIRSVEILGIGDIIASTVKSNESQVIAEIHFNHTQLYNWWKPYIIKARGKLILWFVCTIENYDAPHLTCKILMCEAFSCLKNTWHGHIFWRNMNGFNVISWFK